MVDRHLLIRILGTTALTSLWPWLLAAPPAFANPQGATVVGGSALVVTTSPTVLNVDQSSQNAVINWQSFSVGAGEQTNFHQPSASSLTVNRVTGVDPSTIAGQITANGRVVLTNPNGVVVSQGARVNAGSFIATTSGITNSNAMAGNLDFTVGSSSPTASVVNKGRITVRQGGLAALVAPGVENDGVIVARLGKVALASGQTFTIDLEGDRLVNFAVNGQVLSRVTSPDGTPLSAAVTNAGKIIANGGLVAISVDAAEGVVNQAINMSGIVQATSAHEVAGTIVLNGGAGGVVNMTGTLDASGNRAGESGGRVSVRAGSLISQTGTITASGAVSGGRVRLTAPEIVNQGQISADAQSGAGGTIAIRAPSAYIDTEYSTLSAQSLGAGAGGSISIASATTGSIFLSGTHSVRSASGVGGSVALSAGTVDLVGATIDASGASGGGSIDIGGDLHGAGPLADATTTLVTPGTVIDADARTSGNGGNVVVWSNESTTFAGAISAQGGPAAGNGGFVEVSSKGDLVYAGTADVAAAAGTAGTLLLDPANIVIDETGGGVAQYQLIDPSGSNAVDFGAQIVTLANGNIAVTDPNATVGTATTAGAVYLYNGVTAQLVSMLTGSTAGDQVGSGAITTLASGNFLAPSPSWASNTGAVTFGNAATGVAGIVSATNSLVGSTAGDMVGSGGIAQVGSGNYVVISPNWNGGVGAATFGNGTTGVSGAISPTAGAGLAASLTGSAAGDDVGSGGIVVLTGGDYLVVSPNWGSGGTAIFGLGAVTYGSGATGVSGVVSGVGGAANSLVGSTPGDQLGASFTDDNGTSHPGVVALGPTDSYVVDDPSYSSPTANQVGAVVWADGPLAGMVASYPSLVGSTADDRVGSGGIVVLANGNFVVASPDWQGTVGAVTWGSATAGFGFTSSTAVSSANSLVGEFEGDYLGLSFTGYNGGLLPGIVALNNGNYVVDNPGFPGATDPQGAVVWANGSVAASGSVGGALDNANQLVGNGLYDQVGDGGIQLLANGNFVVLSPDFGNNGDTHSGMGAATFGNAASGFAGAGSTTMVGSGNSLVGVAAGDQVGSGGAVALSNGNYVVLSPNWANGSAALAGAATWGSGISGVSGTISTANSLVGSAASDQVGSSGAVALNNGNYVVLSPNWANGTAALAGAATWGSGASGVSGAVSVANSLVGAATFDQVGSGNIDQLPNGDYLVQSPNYGSGGTAGAGLGAVTWGSGASGVSGVISAANSLVGSTSGDEIGSGGIFTLGNGNYVVSSPNWNGGVGAATFGDDATGGAVGAVSDANSLVGATPGDEVASGGVTALDNGNYVVVSPLYGSAGNASLALGAATWGSGAAGVSGTISSSNSLVGSAPGDQIASSGVTPLYDGNYVVVSPNYGSGGTAGAGLGAVTWGDGAAGSVVGVVSSANSLVGSNPGDQVGNGGVYDFTYVNTVVNGQTSPQLSQFYVVLSPSWNGGAGAITLGSGASGISGPVSVDNSLVGSAPGAGLAYRNFDSPYFGSMDYAVIATENEGSGGQVVLGLFDPNLLTFAVAGGQTVTLSAGSLDAALAIENVTLQATNDITVAYNISSASTNNLELDAGGSITIDQNVTVTLGGTFTAVANDVVGPQTGTGGITLMSGAVIDPEQPDAGVSLTVDSGGTPGPIDLAAGSTVIGGGGPVTINSAGALVADGTVTGGTVLAMATSGITLGGTITASDTAAALTLVSGGAFINTYGAGALDTPNGNWLVYSQNPANDTIGGLPIAFEQYNAPYNTTPAVANADGLLYALAPTVYVSGVSKTYDGTTTATLTAGDYTVGGVVGGDTVTLDASSGSYATKNAGTGIDVSFTGLAVASAMDGTTPVYGYQVDAPGAGGAPSAIGTINPEPLTVTAATNTKTYDGTTSAAATPTVTSGTLYDSATLAETYASRNAGSGLTLTPTATIDDGDGGNDYIVTLVANTTGIISPEALTVTAQTSTKTYDGTPSSTIMPVVTSGTLYDPASFSESYATRNAGGGLTLTPTATIDDGNGGNNYAVTLVANTTGLINPEALTVTATTNTKTYDGTTSAAAAPVVTSGTLYDSATLSETYASPNAGSGLTLTAAAAINDGNGGNNYAVTFVANTMGVINPAALTVSAVPNTKSYDGTTSAAAAPQIISGTLYGGDIGSFSETYASANAGGGITLTATGTVSDPGNYTLSFLSSPTGVITPAELTVTVSSASRVYGTANPAFAASVSGLEGSDTTADLGLSVATSAMNPGRFVGPAGIGGVTSAGASVGDYPITAAITDPNYALNLLPGTLVVTPASLEVMVNDASRLYGAANPLLTGSVSGLIGTDSAGSIGLGFSTTAVGGTPAAAGSNIGAYPITAAITSANYTLLTKPGTLDVEPAPLTVAVGSATRYVGQSNPPFAALLSGLAGADTPASIGLAFATSAIGGAGGVGGSPAGRYPITASFVSGDYVETLIPGSLLIQPAPANGIANVSFVIPQSFNIFERTPPFLYLGLEDALSSTPPTLGGYQPATTNLDLILVGSGPYGYIIDYFAPISDGLLLPISP